MGYLDDLFRFGGTKAVTVQDSASVTALSEEQYRAQTITFSGTLTAARTVRFPLKGGVWAVENSTSGGHSLTVGASSGSSITLYNSEKTLIYCNGSGFVKPSPAGADSTADTYANIPASPFTGARHLATDIATELVYDGAEWRPLIGGTLGHLPQSTWLWINQGDATVVSNGTQSIVCPNSSGGDSLRLRTYPAGGATWSVTAHVRYVGVGNSSGGLHMRESSTGKVITWGPYQSNMAVKRWTNPTTLSANTSTLVRTFNSDGFWLRITEGGGDRDFDYSPDGVSWVTVYTEATGSFLTPNEAGFFANTNSGPAIVTLDSWVIA